MSGFGHRVWTPPGFPRSSPIRRCQLGICFQTHRHPLVELINRHRVGNLFLFDQLAIEFCEKSNVVALGESELQGQSAFLGEQLRKKAREVVHFFGAVNEKISRNSTRQDAVSQRAPIEETVDHVLVWECAKMHFTDPEAAAHFATFVGFANQVNQVPGIYGAITKASSGAHGGPDAGFFKRRLIEAKLTRFAKLDR